MTQQDFQKIHQRVKNYHILNNSKHGFELKINSKWQYDDIEYDIKNNTLSCLGVSIKVDLKQNYINNIEDLFEKMLQKGYEAEF